MRNLREKYLKIITILLLSCIFALFTYAYFDINDYKNVKAKDYYTENTNKETGSLNYVTGIYLDYRLFDSLFEAAILLITATGIVFMSKKESV